MVMAHPKEADMQKHPIWTTLGHDKGDLCSIDALRADGTRRTHAGKVLGWTASNKIVIETLENEDGALVRKKRGIDPEDAKRAWDADRIAEAAERRANAPKATDAQVQYAEDLLVRVGTWGWRHTSLGHTPIPTVDELRAMTKYEISDLIDTLKFGME